MKRSLFYFALAGLLATVGCSGDSPKPAPLPTPTSVTWNITSLTSSDSTPYVGTVISISAAVTKNGGAAPDGTTVEFLAAGPSGASYGFNSAGVLSAEAATSNGTALVVFVASGDSAAGDYVIQARAGDVTAQITVAYRDYEASDNVQIYTPLIPDVGSLDGGEQVTLNGKGIVAPVEVYFVVNGVSYQAVTVDVQESEPLSADGSVTITTPVISGADPAQEWPASVRVDVGVDTASFQTVTLSTAFTFLQQFFDPEIYVVVPDHGSARGGEQVTILGRNFQGADGSSKASPRGLHKTVMQALGVSFGSILADEVAVSPDGTQIVVTTPQYSAAPIGTDVSVSVTVEAAGGTATKANAFVYTADEPTPQITGIEPVAGPLDGGTRVTIFGHGFQFPVQVLFGPLEAEVVNVFDDTTAADNDEIICLSPDYSQQPDIIPPVSVTVGVTNVETGKQSGESFTFTYGDRLFISGNTPSEGPLDSLVIIYGSGFEDPLQVTFGSISLEPIAVSGTELVVHFPDTLEPSCSDTSGSFTVTLLDSDLSVTGGRFTLLGNSPTITSVDPIFVDGGETVTIHGQGFTDDVLVSIGGYVMPTNAVTVVDENTITVSGVPDPDDFGLTFDTSPCTTGGGQPGMRDVPTPVDLTVTNFPGNCSDTLAGGLIYRPPSNACVVAPDIDVAALSFPDTEAGPDYTCSAAQPLQISNLGGGALNISTLTLLGRFYFNTSGNQSAGPINIAAFGFDSSLDVYFCPDQDNGLAYPGQLVIVSNDPDESPLTISLSAQEAFPVMGASPNPLDFGTTGGTLSITITNTTGTAPLDWSAAETDDPDGVFSFPGSTSGTIAAGGNATLDVAFTTGTGPPSGTTYSGTVQISSSNPDAQNAPIDVTLAAEEP